MTKMFLRESLNVCNIGHLTYDLDAELKKHAWHPTWDALKAEAALYGKPNFTYVIHLDYDRKFMISFVNKQKQVVHDRFTLIDSKFGIWRNGNSSHVGRLETVLRDMMHCRPEEGQPLD